MTVSCEDIADIQPNTLSQTRSQNDGYLMEPPRLRSRTSSCSSSTSGSGYMNHTRRSSTARTISSMNSIEGSKRQTSLEARLARQRDAQEYSSFFDAPATSVDSSSISSGQCSRDSNPYSQLHNVNLSTALERIRHTRRPSMEQTSLVTESRRPIAKRSVQKPGEAFKKLPKEVLDMIFERLRDVHLRKANGETTCSTCWMRDICSMMYINKQCFRSAQGRLYESIWLAGTDSSKNMQKLKIKAGARLKLLSATLKADPKLAAYVRELKIPEMAASLNSEEKEKYIELIVSVIMVCPNLQRYIGPGQEYSYRHSRIAEALMSRKELVERVWDISMDRLLPPPLMKRWSWTTKPRTLQPVSQTSNLSLYSEQSKIFVNQHDNWQNMKTLVIRCLGDGNIDPRTICASVERLLSLRNLALSNIPRLSTGLLCGLPPLQALHLHNSTTLTTQALSTFAASTHAKTLRSLSLIHVSVTSLPVLTRLFSNLTSLRKFVFIQDRSPILPAGSSIYLHPYFFSHTVEHITWDLLTPSEEPLADATQLLAMAIQAKGFPALTRIKAPCDYYGHIQAQCRPILYAATPPAPSPSFVSHVQQTSKETSKNSTVLPRQDSGISMLEADLMSTEPPDSPKVPLPTRSLTIAKESAAMRAYHYYQMTQVYTVRISDYSITKRPRVVAHFEFGGVLGKTGTDCSITYDLADDGNGKDVLGFTVNDLIEGRKESGPGVNGGRGKYCDGKWKKRKDGLHITRNNWLPLGTECLF